MAGKELTLDEMKAVELGILKKFDSICKENGLEYSLAYGTMLGAIRHKGFIPWDDDIDVFMKREDYEKLLKLKYDDGDFEIKSYRYSKNYYFLYSKMVDKRTYIWRIGARKRIWDCLSISSRWTTAISAARATN